MPQTPAPPSPPKPSGTYQIKVGSDGIQVTRPGEADAIATLQAQAQVLRARIADAGREIDAIKTELASDGAQGARTANQARLAALEGRRIDAEEQLLKVEDQLAGIGVTPQTVEAVGVPVGEPVIPFDPNASGFQERIAMVASLAIVFIGAPIAVAIARLLWKRATAVAAPSRPSAADSERLARVEQSIDAMAVELERMGEGQRFVTKLLAERNGAEPAEALPVRPGERVDRA